MKPMNIILCGYHWTGCRALESLLSMGHEVFVYTHESPYYVPSLIDLCRARGIAHSVENISKSSLPFEPDIISSVYYRYILSKAVIERCGGRVFNLHPSLLPHYRGCSSLTWALINGETMAGYTYHYINEGTDTGDTLIQREVPIERFDTQATLYQRVMTRAMDDFETALELVAEGARGTPQVGEGSYYGRGCPHGGQIDPTWEPERIERFIRAMIHPPYPLARLGDQEVSSYEAYLDLRGAAEGDTSP